MENRFNNLTSKEWLPFQKSWFLYENDEKLYTDNVRFFIKFDSQEHEPNLFYYGDNERRYELIIDICQRHKIRLFREEDFNRIGQLQFAIFDIRDSFNPDVTLHTYPEMKSKLVRLVYALKDKMAQRRFLSIFMKNRSDKNKYYPFAWDLAKTIATTYSLKDEKIGCTPYMNDAIHPSGYFHTADNFFYCLYFRNDEHSQNECSYEMNNYFTKNEQLEHNRIFDRPFPNWFILKPPPRKKHEILHPAKFPEDLVTKFVQTFTNEYDNVFDPMSGTGSTQLAALMNNRNGYGTELSEFFCGIARNRCFDFLYRQGQLKLYETPHVAFKILVKDARKIHVADFPTIDYIITSPPYWDMLNMKGAEYQARRKEQGLQLNYSGDSDDLGNIDDYRRFLDELTAVYFSLIDHLKPGSFITIVVKNIKKKGQNYPFAWDLSEILQQKLILLPETFWLQDDISIAPYGYGNTFVSNTFHHYCLTFQKPI